MALCYAYGFHFNAPLDSKPLTTLYCGMDEEEAVRIARSRFDDFTTIVVMEYGGSRKEILRLENPNAKDPQPQ